MGIVLAGLLVCGGGALFGTLFKRGLAQTAPMFVLCVPVVMYLCGMAGMLDVGVWLLAAAALCGYGLLLWRAVRQKSVAMLKDWFFTPAFFALIAIFVIVYIISYNRRFIWGDEFGFWGLAVKESVRTGQMFNHPGTTVDYFRDYTPALILFEHFWCRLSGGYSEPSVYRALQFFTLVLYLPAFGGLKWRHWPAAVGLLAMTVLLSLVSSVVLYGSVYIDATMGVLLGYTLYLAASWKGFDAFSVTNLAVACFVVCLAKQMGVFILVLILLYLLALTVWRAVAARREGVRVARLWRAPAGMLGIGAGAALVALGSWRLWLVRVGVSNTTFSFSAISPATVAGALAGRGTPEQTATVKAFFETFIGNAILRMPLMTATFAQTVLLVGLVGAVLAFYHRGSKHAPRLAVLAVALPLGMLLYAFSMLTLYLFSFSPAEAVELASYDRYMSSIIIAASTALLLTAAHFFARDAKPAGEPARKRGAALAWPLRWAAAGAVVMIGMVSDAAYLGLTPSGRAYSYYPHVEALSAELTSQVDAQNDKVYMIFQGNPRLGLTLTHYYTTPLAINKGGAKLVPPGTPVDPESSDRPREMSAREWGSLLVEQAYDYVYLAEVSDVFIEGYKTLFAPGAPIGDLNLYRVTQNATGVVLEPAE